MTGILYVVSVSLCFCWCDVFDSVCVWFVHSGLCCRWIVRRISGGLYCGDRSYVVFYGFVLSQGYVGQNLAVVRLSFSWVVYERGLVIACDLDFCMEARLF